MSETRCVSYSVLTGRTLHELTFTDAPELRDCYLHNLAAAPSLTLFKCVLLAASPQVPAHLLSPCWHTQAYCRELLTA